MIIVLLAILALIAIYLVIKGPSFYNTGIDLKENTAEQWGNVESAYQRRNDLIGKSQQHNSGYPD